MSISSALSLRDRILERLRDSVGQEKCSRYFGPLTDVECEPGQVRVRVPNSFMAEWLGKRIADPLREAARAEMGADDVDIRIHVEPKSPPRERMERAADVASGACSPERRERDASPVSAGARRETAARRRSASHRAVGQARRLRHKLDDFIVGRSNELAYHAALQMTAPQCPPGFSPLFIHGECGLGKTHLLQGVARRFMESQPGSRVRYTTGEAFTNAFITSVREQKVDRFRKQFRDVDLLCIDDIHFLSNKAATQTEFLHTFNAIGMDGSRVVLASDEHPSKIRQFSRELTSRFMAGMVVQLEMPDLAMREQLVRKLADRRGLQVDDRACRAIAERCVESVREIEGALTRIDALQRLLPGATDATGGVTAGVVERALVTNASSAPRRPVRVEQIAERVCETLSVDLSDLLGRSRHKRVVLARSMSAHLARKMTNMSFPEIARGLGRPNHSTVVTACKRVEEQIRSGAMCDAGPDLASVSVADLAERIARDVQRGTQTPDRAARRR